MSENKPRTEVAMEIDYENLVLTDIETVGDMAVYWIGTRTDTRQFGICFDGPIFNIARQGVAESVVLAFAMFADALDEIEEAQK